MNIIYLTEKRYQKTNKLRLPVSLVRGDYSTTTPGNKVSSQPIQAEDNNLQPLLKPLKYTNIAMHHLSLQNDAIICILEKVLKLICDSVNATAEREKDQEDMVKMIMAAWEQPGGMERAMKEFAKNVPRHHEPVCTYEECSKPSALQRPPKIVRNL